LGAKPGTTFRLDNGVSVCSPGSMRKPVRLPSRVRRQAIVAAVRGTFAEKGFDGTTTRELARAAGVSEALLYKHFPSKESLYAAMLDACANGPMAAEFTRVLALPPSTSTLVVLVHFLTSQFVLCEDAHKITMHRLALRSLLEDADFVRLGAKQFAAGWVRKVEACVRAAAKAGELREIPVRRDLRAWFVHHLAFALMVHLQPKVPAIDYGIPRTTLVVQAVWFVLRGLGLEDEAIRRHYHPEALSRLRP
jgi:AcrR family transcriptional regulator